MLPGAKIATCGGAAARLGVKGDVVIILTYTDVTEEHLKDYKPRIVHVNKKNEIVTKLDEKIFA